LERLKEFRQAETAGEAYAQKLAENKAKSGSPTLSLYNFKIAMNSSGLPYSS